MVAHLYGDKGWRADTRKISRHWSSLLLRVCKETTACVKKNQRLRSSQLVQQTLSCERSWQTTRPGVWGQGRIKRTVLAMNVFFLSKFSRCASRTRLLQAPARQVLIIKGAWPFDIVRLGVITPDELQFAVCDLIRMIQSDSFWITLRRKKWRRATTNDRKPKWVEPRIRQWLVTSGWQTG